MGSIFCVVGACRRRNLKVEAHPGTCRHPVSWNRSEHVQTHRVLCTRGSFQRHPQRVPLHEGAVFVVSILETPVRGLTVGPIVHLIFVFICSDHDMSNAVFLLNVPCAFLMHPRSCILCVSCTRPVIFIFPPVILSHLLASFSVYKRRLIGG